MDFERARERLKRFAETWNNDDLVCEKCGLTGADLKAIIEHLEAETAGPA